MNVRESTRRVRTPAGEACVTHGTGLRAEPPGHRARRSARIPEVTVNLKRVLVWLAIAFVLFYVIQQPESSADMVRSAGTALGDAASSFATFVSSLV